MYTVTFKKTKKKHLVNNRMTTFPSVPRKITEQVLMEAPCKHNSSKVTGNSQHDLQIIPDKSAICSEMTGSKHKESTGNAVYLSVCKVFNAVSQYCLCLIGGMCSLQDGWEIICITRLKEKLLILPSLTGIPHGLTTMLLQMPFLRG